jgi:peroxiredoxin
MNLIDVLIPLVPGVVLVAFPHILTPKTASAEDAAKRTSKTRKIGYVLVGVAAL